MLDMEKADADDIMRKCTHEAAGIRPVFNDGMEPRRKEYLVRLVEACRQAGGVLSQDGHDVIIDGSYSDIPVGSLHQGHSVVAYGHEERTWKPYVLNADRFAKQLRALLSDDWDAASMPTIDTIREAQVRRLWDLEPLIERCIGLPIIVGGTMWKVGGFNMRYGSSPLCLTRLAPGKGRRPRIEEDYEDPRMLADELREIAKKASKGREKKKERVPPIPRHSWGR